MIRCRISRCLIRTIRILYLLTMALSLRITKTSLFGQRLKNEFHRWIQMEKMVGHSLWCHTFVICNLKKHARVRTYRTQEAWTYTFLAFTFGICYRPSVCRLFVCLSSVTLVRPILRRFKFSAIFLRRLIPWPSTPPPGELNTRGIAKYSDFGPNEDYISETVQDRK